MSNLNPGGLTRVLNYIKTWVTGLLNDKANSSHSHTKSQITDFPTIPTVNNATLTIQKNGTTVNSFTANASSNVTANISVPTKVSELTNDSGYITSSGSCNYANSAGAVAWDNVSGKPSTYTPSSHTHDDRYYTESEINTKLSSKSDTSHNHNSTYLGISAKAESAKVADYAKLLAYSYSNEINFKGGRQATCYFNYRNADDDSTGTAATVEYTFCNYGGGVSNVTVSAGTFKENGSSLADKYQAKGSYASSSHTHTKSQITDFPTIPTVNNATLTIQKNGSNVATFTSNASSNVTANITVPTKTSQLTNDSGFITGIAWSNVSSRPYMVDNISYKSINGSFSTQYRTQTKGNTTHNAYLSVIRTDTNGVAKCPVYGSGIASGMSDTHFYIYCSYSGADAYIGGGNGDKLNWISRINVEDNTYLNGYRVYVG